MRTKHSRCSLCASLTYVLRTRHPCLFSNEIHFVQLTFLQQLRKVSKRSRPPASHLSLRFSTNTGRENAFPTRLSLRLHPCNRPSVSLRCSGSLESVNETKHALRLLISTEKYSLPSTIPDNSKILEVFRISTRVKLRNGKNLTCTTSYGVC